MGRLHTKRLLFLSEPNVDSILKRRLSHRGYRICPKVRLADVIGRPPKAKRLPQRAFEYLLTAHLDFLVTRNDVPVFAVEFDGTHHLTDAKTIERDYLKNRLCKAAGLPILRIMSREIREHERVTLLDYMLMRYLAWEKGFNRDEAIDPDPSVDFDLRHPFPLTDSVQRRLWRRYRLASIDDYERCSEGPRAVYLVQRGWRGPLEHDEFHTCKATALVWPSAEARQGAAQFRHEISVTLRSCIRLRPNPRIDEGDFFGLEMLEHLMTGLPAGCVEEVWFPELPGANAWDISEHFADYLGCSAIERWARTAWSVH